ncbi:MAG: hypothetical protein AB7K09_01940 [Planctomycetota bacterium]
MAGKGAAAGGAGVITVVVVGVLGFFGIRPGDNTADNNDVAANVPAVNGDNTTVGAGSNNATATQPPAGLKPLKTINELIAAVQAIYDAGKADPPVKPTAAQLEQVFSGPAERVRAIDRDTIIAFKSKLYLCQEVMKTEFNSTERPGEYQTSQGPIVLEACADGGLRVQIK